MEPKQPNSVNDPLADHTESLKNLVAKSKADVSRLEDTLDVEVAPIEPLCGLEDSRPVPAPLVQPEADTAIDFSSLMSPAELGGVGEFGAAVDSFKLSPVDRRLADALVALLPVRLLSLLSDHRLLDMISGLNSSR